MQIRRPSSGRSAGALVGVVALAVGVTVALGSGYTLARTSLSSASGYVASGDQVAQVNGEARTVDGTSSPTAGVGNPQDVVSLPDGQVGAIDDKTHKVTIVDGATLSPTKTIQAKPGKQPPQLVGSGSTGWLVDPNAAQATPLSTQGSGTPATLPGTPYDAAPGPDGSLIVLLADGGLVEVARGGHVTTLPDETARNGALTVAGGHTYLVTGSGQVVEVDTAPVTVGTIAGVGYGNTGHVLVGSLQGAGTHVLVVSGDTLAIVDPQTGSTQRVALHAHDDGADLGQPVEFDGYAYVPDYAGSDVIRVDEQTLAVVGTLPVPQSGNTDQFQLFVEGGKLWANNQFSQHLLVIDGSGATHTVPKGTVVGGKQGGTGDQGTGRTTPRPNPVKVPNPILADGGNGGSQGDGGGGGNPTGTIDPTGGGGNGGGRGHQPGNGSGSPSGSSSGGHGSGDHGGGGTTPPKQVMVPTFPAGTNYQDACQQLKTDGLVCLPVSGGYQNGQSSGDVIRTDPAGGQSETVGTTVDVYYVGPTAVPPLPTDQPVTPADECQAITGAGLTCVPQASTSPAPALADFGTVTTLSPAGGTQVPTKTTVTVTYYGSFTMPNYAAKSGTAFCVNGVLNAADPGSSDPTASDPSQNGPLTLALPNATPVHPTCTAPAGSPATSKDQAGQVYQEDPAAGSVVTVDPTSGAAVTLTTYNGTVTVPDWSNPKDPTTGADPDMTTVTGECGALFTCNPAQGDNPSTPANAGRFEKSDPPAGTQVQVGSTVTLYYWGNSGAVPNVVNTGAAAPANVCDQVTAAGFQCQVVAGPAPPTDTVGSAYNETPTGTQAFGTMITVNEAAAYQVYRQYYKDGVTDKVDNILQPQTDPSGYTRGTQHSYAYAPGSFPGGVTLDHWSCAKCGDNGKEPLDEYIAEGNSPTDPNLTDQGPEVELMPLVNGTCPDPMIDYYQLEDGLKRRVWIDDDAYSSDETPPVATSAIGAQLWGCGWAAPP